MDDLDLTKQILILLFDNSHLSAVDLARALWISHPSLITYDFFDGIRLKLTELVEQAYIQQSGSEYRLTDDGGSLINHLINPRGGA